MLSKEGALPTSALRTEKWFFARTLRSRVLLLEMMWIQGKQIQESSNTNDWKDVCSYFDTPLASHAVMGVVLFFLGVNWRCVALYSLVLLARVCCGIHRDVKGQL